MKTGRRREGDTPRIGSTQRALALSAAVALAFYLAAGLAESAIVRLLHPSEAELSWISDALLSVALGTAVYLWLHLRMTRRALTARERSQLVLDTQLAVAESMQRRLLPAVPAPSAGVAWAAVLEPAGRIGGDFYDFVEPTPGVWLLLLADVSGKGIGAAMALALLRATFRNIATGDVEPAEMATRLSATIHREWSGSPYVTALVVRVELSTRRMTYTNAGHPRGLLIRQDATRTLGDGGPPLGLLPEAGFTEGAHGLQPGDVLVLMTDGISEALDDAPEHWVREAARPATPFEAQAAPRIAAAIVERARQGRGPADGWSDDRTVVVLTVDAS